MHKFNMNKKAMFDSLFEIILWIVFLLIALGGMYLLINYILG